MELELLLLGAALISAVGGGRTVCTPGSCYVGGLLDTPTGGSYSSFQGTAPQHRVCTVSYPGIRYAEPPIGQLRLSLPVRREAGLEAELDVSGISEVVCPQWGADLTSILGQEDCLLLNVYVPGIKHLTRL